MTSSSEDQALHRMETVIGTLLRWGVMASLALVLAGTVLTLARGRYGSTSADVARLTAGEAMGDPTGRSLIVAGLVLLIATPILRVIVSIVGFAIQRDRAFVWITSIVLALLGLSFAIGVAQR